jgi:hypothetical protein
MEKAKLPDLLVAVVLIVVAACAPASAISKDRPAVAEPSPAPSLGADQEPVEIAEGEYSISKEYGGVGPMDAEIFNFREHWLLSRTAGDNYEIEGSRTFESPQDCQQEIAFLLRLSPELRPMEAEEYTSLLWLRHSGPLTCNFLPGALRCATKGDDPNQHSYITLPMDKPYAFSWPLSAFSLAALTRQIGRHDGKEMEVELVDIEQPSNDVPVMPMITSGTLRFIGEEKVVAAGRTWEADEFELQAFMSPLPGKSLLWVSKGGLLLALEAERNSSPQWKLKLTQFKEKMALPLFR